MRTRLAIASCLLIGASLSVRPGPGAMAAAGPERWDPVSTTARAITGPVTMFRDHVRFGNGAILALASSGRPVRMEVDGQAQVMNVLRVPTPSDPVLLNGNTLCGMGPATWLAVGGEGTQRTLAVYTGAVPPPESTRLCGTFRYESSPR